MSDFSARLCFMRRFQTSGLVLVTAILSVGATLLLRAAFSEESRQLGGGLPGQYHSSILREERAYVVSLPASYDRDTAARYPVLYLLDAASQVGHTASSAALLARLGIIPELIVVGVSSVNGETRNRDFTPPDMRVDEDGTNSRLGQADRFLASLQSELLPRIEATYRTARPRMLAGWSRGALFVVYAELQAPPLFDAGFAHSPALWREGDRIVDQVDRALGADSVVRAEFLYLSLGEDENAKMKASFLHLQRVLKRHEGAGLRWESETTRGGTHETNPVLSTPVGLCVFLGEPVGNGCRRRRPATVAH